MGDNVAPGEGEYDHLWSAIENGEVEVLKCYAPGDFNWRSLHPTHKITVLQCLLSNLITYGSNRPLVPSRKNEFLEVAKWLVERGADPLQKAAANSQHTSTWVAEGHTTGKFNYAGKSVVTLILQFQETFRNMMRTEKGNWSGSIKILSELLDTMRGAAAKTFSSKISIPEAVVDTYDAFFRDKESADLTIECKNSAKVHCHQAFVSKLSSVLQAMLTSGMQEGETKKIIVPDADAKDVELFLEVCYCGSITGEKKPVSNLLGAIELAHRWQISFAVEFLESILVERVNLPNFEKLSDVAVLIELPSLKAKLQDFCDASNSLKKSFQEGKLSGGALQIAESAWGRKSDAAPAKKKRRAF